MVHCAIPLQKAAITDLHKMDAIQFICNHPSEFRPGKEFTKYRETEWSRDSGVLRYQVEKIRRKSTNGMSISYKDIIDKDHEGYFDGTNVNREQLAHFGNGLTESEVFGDNEENNKIRGVSVADAIKDYRTIKSFVPKSGGLSNSLMALAIAKNKNRVSENSTAMDLIHNVAHAKHVLCQDGLSAKHGCNTMENADKLFAGFYNTFENVLKTEYDYRKCMEDLGLSQRDIDSIIEIYWCGEPENINNMLKVVAPHYLLTRRSANFITIEDTIDNYDSDCSLQKDFIEKIIKPGVVYESQKHTNAPRRSINQIPREESKPREFIRVPRKSQLKL